ELPNLVGIAAPDLSIDMNMHRSPKWTKEAIFEGYVRSGSFPMLERKTGAEHCDKQGYLAQEKAT
ncbi:MAG TPA: hypothetical protein GX700_13300, partial [Paracoccus sp.]|nr:hypothetical protein [Paracoccus sp. (in: a-proteobacteria)]